MIAGSLAADVPSLLADGVGAELQWHHHAQQVCREGNGKCRISCSFGGREMNLVRFWESKELLPPKSASI